MRFLRAYSEAEEVINIHCDSQKYTHEYICKINGILPSEKQSAKRYFFFGYIIFARSTGKYGCEILQKRRSQ